jgi:hypothetical protein
MAMTPVVAKRRGPFYARRLLLSSLAADQS